MGLRWACIAAAVATLVGCGGRSLPGQDLGARRDAPDLRVPVDVRPAIDWGDPDILSWPPQPPPTRACDPTIIGFPCSQHGGECGLGGTCLLLSQTQGGVCGCLCTPDDPNTPLVNEDDCPADCAPSIPVPRPRLSARAAAATRSAAST